MLLELAFISACHAPNLNQDACQKAVEAASKQSGVYQNVSATEDYAQKYVYKNVTSVTGEVPWTIAAISYKTYKDKAISYSFKPKVLPVDRITPKVGYDQKGTGSLNLEWKF